MDSMPAPTPQSLGGQVISSTLLATRPTGKKGGNGEKRDKETELEEDNIEREGGEYELFVDMNLVWENLLLLKREKVV